MSRFFLTQHASSDLDEIRRYLDPIPRRFTESIRRDLLFMLREIAAHPQRGAGHSEATRLLGQQVLTRTLPPYRFFYRETRGIPEVIAILHTAQDVETILRQRLH